MTNHRGTTICAIAKNEAPYLAEWVLYHKLIGFEHIHIFNNNSNDNTAEVLKDLESLGLVSCMDWDPPPTEHIQRSAYTFGLGMLREQSEWICFLDIDEFMVIPGLDCIQKLITQIPEIVALGINWKIFGTSFHERREPGLVIERFTKASLKEHRGNLTVKTFVKTTAISKPNLHNHTFAPGVVYESIDRLPIPPDSMHSQNVNHDIIRIHHYFTKSREEWDAKVARGRATKPDGHKDKFRKEDHFRMHNKNDEDDAYLMKFAPTIRRDIEKHQLFSCLTL
jgi:hypothetical protein